PPNEGSEIVGTGPAPLVERTRPLDPAPAPEAPADVPPGPPPEESVVVKVPSVPVTRPDGEPSNVPPALERRISVSEISRLYRAIAISKLFSSASMTASPRLR